MLTKSWEVLEEQAPAGPPGAAIKRTTHTAQQRNKDFSTIGKLVHCWLWGHVTLAVSLGSGCHRLDCQFRNTSPGPKSRGQEAGSIIVGSGALIF